MTLQGNCLDRLRELPNESVQCVVTSPPYWGLRDYGIPPVEWPSVTWSPMAGLDPFTTPAESSVHGLEPSLSAFVAHEVLIFREVRRVLKSDGVCFVNLGDSYSQSRCGEQGQSGQMADRSVAAARCRGSMNTEIPGKNILGTPWRVAFALQADGWFLRQDIIWHKPNPMPESVTDRCTKAHEYIFLLTKSERYYWDQDAVREKTGRECSEQEFAKAKETSWPSAGIMAHNGTLKGSVPRITDPNGRNPRSVWSIQSEAFPEAHFATFPSALPRRCILAATRPGDTVLDPFGGSGTTGMVATELGRKPILIEANPEYVKLIKQRMHVTPGLPI